MHKIVVYDNPVLRKKAEPVGDIDKKIRLLLKDMAGVMSKEGGVGIAAPQVGESVQAAIVDISPKYGGKGRIVLLNPRIISGSGSSAGDEGCLSVPGVQVKVKRYHQIKMEGLNINGELVNYQCSGLLARAMQHEIDHLNGILIIDKMNKIRKYLAERKYYSSYAEKSPLAISSPVKIGRFSRIKSLELPAKHGNS